jgi:hypothetical protein
MPSTRRRSRSRKAPGGTICGAPLAVCSPISPASSSEAPGFATPCLRALTPFSGHGYAPEMQNFFDRYPRFLTTSVVGTQPEHGQRLHWRWRAIVAENLALFDNANVLDLASHDGRWSMAALDAKAASVVGIEGRQNLVDNARETLGGYGVYDSAKFIVGDVLAVMPKIDPAIDLILNLGFLYHTPRHYEVFEQMARLKPKAIILDTSVAAKAVHAITRYSIEKTTWPGAAIGDGRAIIGLPSPRMIEIFTEFFGYSLSAVDWHALGITDWTGVEDYRDERRRTYVLTRS